MKPCLGLLSFACSAIGTMLAMACLSPVCVAADVRIEQRILVDSVWSGQPVGFSLLTDTARRLQYVGYYDDQQNMVVASRPLDAKTWTKKILPSKIGWDSHNYVTLAIDKEGHLHVAGNMHNSPLIYFRSAMPGDISGLAAIPCMTGKREDRMTYPQFINGPDGALYFTYRDGQSGRGSNLYNRYDEKRREWSRLIDTPLFDGLGRMSAYPEGPLQGPDGYWHMAWLWRDTPDAATCHDLGYAKSRDLVHWQTIAGNPIALPISAQTPGVILDPIPPGGGIINGSGKLGFDKQGRVVVAYHKFDTEGATQVYLARAGNGTWDIRPITKWSYRWKPKGYGAIRFDIRHSGVQQDLSIGLYMFLYNARHGGGNWRLDPDTLALGERIPDEQVPNRVPPELGHGVRAPLKLLTARDSGNPPSGMRYLLRWEALPENGDRPREGPLPPSQLEIVTLKIITPVRAE